MLTNSYSYYEVRTSESIFILHWKIGEGAESEARTSSMKGGGGCGRKEK